MNSMKKNKINTRINPGDRREPLDQAAPQDLIHFPPSRTDPEGMYTGRPSDPFDRPQQDADDL